MNIIYFLKKINILFTLYLLMVMIFLTSLNACTSHDSTNNHTNITAENPVSKLTKTNESFSDILISDMSSGWTHSGTGSLIADTNLRFNRIQSQKIVTQDDRTNSYAIFTAASLIDMAGYTPVLWLYWSGSSEPYISVAMSSDASGFTNKWVWAHYGLLPNSVINPGTWVRITLPWSDAQIVGSPNRASIKQFEILANSSGASLWVGEFAKVLQPSQGIVSFTFDDGSESIYTYGATKLHTYKEAGTFFLYTDSVGTRGNMSISELNTMQNWGWDISGHYFNPPDFTTYNLTTTQSIYESVKNWLNSHGYNGYNFWAFPGGAYTEEQLALAKQYFYSTRGVSQSIETYPPADWYRLKTINLGYNLSLAAAKAYVDAAFNNHDWVIFESHVLTITPTTGLEWSISDFNKLVDYINSKNMKVSSISEVYDQYLSDYRVNK